MSGLEDRVVPRIGFLIASLVGGLYLAGLLTLTLLGLDSELTRRAWWPYLQTTALRQFAPYVWKIKLATAVGFIVPLAV